jgi:hypothetical protein
VLAETFGDAEAKRLGGVTGRLIGMQYYAETAGLLGIDGHGPEAFAEYLVRMGLAQDDRIEWVREAGEVVVRQHTWRLMQGVASPPAAVFDSWNALWQGALSVHNRRLVLEVRRRLDQGDPCFEWCIRPKPPSL